ncbi:uncharacterized protein A1O9_12257 [Exophiala aquamarina CBS 119918]|uniref:Major facilitator superfamily (MFS) profile domain-containing protein n=1 Tax=Exophiala aquamarina CBS 119918 TaxID=1182545 RepID=A0A072NW31_9EURO|nr:uncharacterized protein A1O9_12257 [Exophiala aquamarina CBS 119918]KEF51622.1 hypothetical protein A1O9_12257 [Exophiala aquamarina CBS 119918]
MANKDLTGEKEPQDPVMVEHDDQPTVNLSSSLGVSSFMAIFAIWIALSGWMVNFDISYGGTVLQMESFRKSFGHCRMVKNPTTGVEQELCALSATAQSMVSFSQLFSAIGAAFSGLVGSYLGRRGAIQFGCLIVIIGAACQCATTGNYVAYNVCKCISCFGVGHVNAVGPLFGVEVIAPRRRGALVAVFGIGLSIGLLTSSCVCYGTSTIGNNWEWRTPVVIQIPLALMYAGGLTLFPESPRWLLLKGREEKARHAFAKFYGKDPHGPEITAQMRETQSYIELEMAQSGSVSWTGMFHKSYIRRTAISIFVNIAGPFSGIPLVGTYAAVFFAAAGVTKPFLTQVYLGVCGLVGACLGPFIIEYIGRRRSILFALAWMSSCMLVFSTVASGLGSSSEISRKLLIACICLWFFIYASCLSSSHWIVGAEVHSVSLRTYGGAIAVFAANAAFFAASFWTPYMINPTAGNMGTNVGYFYLGMSVVSFFIMFLLLPETARLSLEQIDDHFRSGRQAWRTSLSRNKLIAKGEMCDVTPEERNQSLSDAANKNRH